MAKVNVFHDEVGNTLVVWFGSPEEEVKAEETDDDIILMKDKNGKVIGFEKLNFLSKGEEPVQVAFEAISASAT